MNIFLQVQNATWLDNLITCEETRFQIIKNNSTVTKKILCPLGETSYEFRFVFDVKSRENSLVKLLSKFIFFVKTTIQRIARLTLTPFELKFRSLFGNTNQPHQLHLIIFIKGSVQKFVFPVGTACYVKNAMRLGIAVHDGQTSVVSHGSFFR